MNKFRESIYNFLFNSKQEDIYQYIPNGTTMRTIKKSVWSEKIDFTKEIREEDYWFESAVTMPVISKMFGVNCICYSMETETTNDVTCASIQKKTVNPNLFGKVE